MSWLFRWFETFVKLNKFVKFVNIVKLNKILPHLWRWRTKSHLISLGFHFAFSSSFRNLPSVHFFPSPLHFGPLLRRGAVLPLPYCLSLSPKEVKIVACTGQKGFMALALSFTFQKSMIDPATPHFIYWLLCPFPCMVDLEMGTSLGVKISSSRILR